MRKRTPSSTPISPNEKDADGPDITKPIGDKINPKNWDKMLEQSPNGAIEDRRTPDDLKYEALLHRYKTTAQDPIRATDPESKGPKPLSKEELSWMDGYAAFISMKNRQGLDQSNEDYGLILKPGDRYYRKQPNPHPRD